MSRRAIALVVVAFIAGGVIVGVAVAVFGGKSNKVSGPPLTTTTTLPLSESARELLGRLTAGRSLELHATYAQAQSNGTTITVEIYRKAGRVRQDIVLEGAGAKNEFEAFQLPDGNVACQKSQASDFVCQKVSSVAAQSGAAGLFDAAGSNLSGKTVTAKDEKVGSDDARCYTIAASGNDTASEMCVTAEGIPVRLSAQGSSLVLTKLERSVDDTVFVPPAPLTAATSTTAN